MNETELMRTRIVVGVDGSDTAWRALRAAVDMARSLGSPLTVVSAYEPLSGPELRAERLHAPHDVVHQVQPDAGTREVLELAAATARAAGVVVHTVAREGLPADVILDVAEEMEAGLIVVGNRGMRGRRILRPSVPDTVSHRAPCSVLIVDTVAAAA